MPLVESGVTRRYCRAGWNGARYRWRCLLFCEVGTLSISVQTQSCMYAFGGVRQLAVQTFSARSAVVSSDSTWSACFAYVGSWNRVITERVRIRSTNNITNSSSRESSARWTALRVLRHFFFFLFYRRGLFFIISSACFGFLACANMMDTCYCSCVSVFCELLECLTRRRGHVRVSIRFHSIWFD